MSQPAEVQQAIEAVAREAAWRSLNWAVKNGWIEWGDYPEVGEQDWNAITMHILAIAGSIRPTGDQYTNGYEALKARAGDQAETGDEEAHLTQQWGDGGHELQPNVSEGGALEA